MTRERIVKVTMRTIGTVLLIAGVNLARGQELTSRPERGVLTKGTQVASEIDSVNLQNGGVSLQFPLAALPPMAGGKVGHTLNVRYNSKLWNGHSYEQYGSTSAPGCQPIYSTKVPVPASYTGGWSVGDGYSVFFRQASEDFEYLTPSSSVCWGAEYYHMAYRFFKPMLRMPDGSEHEMRIEGYHEQYTGLRPHLLGYFRYYGSGDPTFNSPVRFYTVDGTYLSVVYNPPSDPVRWTIYMKDGTRVVQTADKQTTHDANGNAMETGQDPAGFLYAKDLHTGRMTKWSQSTYENQPATKVEYQSVGGVWQSVWVVWGETTVRGKLYSKKDWRQGTGGDYLTDGECYKYEEIYETPLQVVRRIVYPSAVLGEGPQTYLFEYNSDVHVQASDPNVSFTCLLSPPPQTYTRTASYGLGQISKITTPTGATVEYDYQSDGTHLFGQLMQDEADAMVRDSISTKTLSHDGEQQVWTYEIDTSGLASGGSVTNPDGSVVSETYKPTNAWTPWLSGDGYEGLQLRVNQGGKVVTEKKWLLLGGQMPAIGAANQYVSFNPVVDTEYTTLLAPNGIRQKMSAKKFSYDYNGELLTTTEYDWFDPSTVTFGSDGIPTGIPAGAVVLRVMENDYHNEAPNSSSSNAYQKRSLGSNTVLLGKLKETTVGTTAAIKSHTRISYDGQTYGTAPTLGNVTKASALDDTNNTWIDTTTTYTPRGNVETVTDARGNVTKMTYGATGGYTDLYPTQTVAAYGTPVARTSAVQYDFYTGLPTLSTDVDNNVSAASEYDILGRVTKVKSAVGTALESWTTTEYSDSNRRVVVRADIEAVGDGKKVAVQHFDQLGRVRLTRTLENAATEDPANEQHGIKVETRYQTGNPNSYQITSNPFRAATATAATNEPTMGWTRSKSWNHGRRAETETFSGAALPAPWGTNTNSTGVVVTESDTDRTLVTDQAGKKRMSRTNAVGQLKDVWELTAQDGSTEAVTFPGYSGFHAYKTSYAYDTLNNLTTVNQGSQTRTFTYSSLSRLLSATNPESGTINYGYDSNGNLTSKTDARNIITTYTYDQLNRVTARDYDDTTPDVDYTYGTSAPKVGKLVKVESSVSTTEYTGFDILGRVTAHKQTTDGNQYTTGYSYNLSGALIEQTYPSGRVVKNTIDAADGSLSQVQSKRSGETWRNYANGFIYNAAGAVTTMRLGNGLWETTQFNSRLQPTQIGLGSGAASQNKLKLDYSYGMTANNGNVLSQTITVPGVTLPFVQNYTYDSLNRLQSADEKPSGWTQTNCDSDPTKCWKQTFTFDRYGNRNFNEANTTTLPKNCGTAPNLTVCSAEVPIVNPSANTANNKLNGTTYDAAGNVIEDAEGREFTYDAENKQVEVQNGSSQLIGQYYFDGDGKRVKKVVPNGETTIFVYDASGRLIGEYSTEVQPTQDAKTQYLTADHLGTPRINTNGVGTVVSRSDYMPYGEEITGGRSSGQGYVTDDVRQGFTGYENDDETGLDFAQARYYSESLGRFTSADLPFAGQWLDDPQTWNLFIYTSNNPLARIDPNGRRWYYRTSGKTLEIQWVNPNDDGSFTAPEGDGWIAQKPGETLSLYSEENDTTYHLSEFEDGTPYMKGIKTNRGVQDVSLETFTIFRIARGSTSVLSGIFGAARGAWASFLARQAEKKLVKELAEMTTDQLTERYGKSGVEMFRDLFGHEFGATVRGAAATKMAREMLEGGLKKIPEGLTREQLLAYRQIALNAIKTGKDTVGTQAERLKTIDYLLTKVKN